MTVKTSLLPILLDKNMSVHAIFIFINIIVSAYLLENVEVKNS